MLDSLTDKDYWIQSYSQSQLSYDENHDISKFLKNWLPYNINGTCIEIGSYPGNFMPILGQLGYELKRNRFPSTKWNDYS